MFNFFKNKISENTGLLIRLDDIAENMKWEYMKKCETIFDKYSIKPILGVIPNNKDKDLLNYEKNENFWEQVRNWQKKGWEISMHGFSHLYDKKTNKLDLFGYGGDSEFFGHDFENQKEKIQKGLKKFADEGIKIRSFFAPNHTYDQNTLKAIKDCGIKNIIDGYGIAPYKYNDLVFMPQLFYKEIMLPFGIQSTQTHINYWSDNDYLKFENFISQNSSKIISFDHALNKVNNKLLFKIINYTTEKILKTIRFFR